jgi:nitrite reductase (NADH) small subunit
MRLEPEEAMHTIDLGSVERIPLGEGRTFSIRDERIAVFRSRDGQLFATQALCPHKGGALADGMLGGGKVLCPLHGYAFLLENGRCLRDGGAEIRIYDVTSNAEGRILLSLSSRKGTVAA